MNSDTLASNIDQLKAKIDNYNIDIQQDDLVGHKCSNDHQFRLHLFAGLGNPLGHDLDPGNGSTALL